MVIREVTAKDMPEIDAILVSHGFPAYSVRYASDMGFCAEKNGSVVGAIFIYVTNSPICTLDLLTVEKSLTKLDKTKAINGMMGACIKRVKDMGYSVLSAEPRFKKSGQRLKGYGFKEMRKGCYWMEFDHG